MCLVGVSTSTAVAQAYHLWPAELRSGRLPISEPIDQYYEWLGIPPKDQPPNYYRLLGIDMFESSPKVIESAADRCMMILRTFQTGRYSEVSQKLLNEVDAARVCLLDPRKRMQYDQQLREELGFTTASNAAQQIVSAQAEQEVLET